MFANSCLHCNHWQSKWKQKQLVFPIIEYNISYINVCVEGKRGKQNLIQLRWKLCIIQLVIICQGNCWKLITVMAFIWLNKSDRLKLIIQLCWGILASRKKSGGEKHYFGSKLALIKRYYYCVHIQYLWYRKKNLNPDTKLTDERSTKCGHIEGYDIAYITTKT